MTLRRAYAATVAGLTAVVGAAVFLTFSTETSCPASAPGLLLTHASENGALQPRWSGCFDAALRKGSGRPSTSLQTRGALAQFEIAAREGSRASLASFGVALALAGEETRGLNALQSVAAERADSEDLSNLAAAHLLRAQKANSAYDLILALEHASHAVTLDAGNPRARYNEALALMALHLDGDADRAWRQYLELESDSSWSDRARDFLGDPRRHLISPALAPETHCEQVPQACRELVEEQLLPAWGRAVLDGADAEAAAVLARAAALGLALTARGDRLDAEAVAAVQQVVPADPARAREMALGLIAYGRARDAFENERDSLPAFGEAERRLAAAGSPLLEWARANRVYAEFSRYDGARLQAIGPELIGQARDAERRGFPVVAGRLQYLAALSFANRTQYAPAEPLYAASIDLLERSRERDHLASSEWGLATMRLRLGDTDDGWRWFLRAFETLPDTPSPRRRYVILLNAAGWLFNLHLDHAAVRLYSSARDEAVAANQPGRVAESVLYRARAYDRLGDLESARRDLDAANPESGRTGAWAQSDRTRAEYLDGLAEVDTTRRPLAAIAQASDALAFFETRAFGARVARLHLVRGRAYEAAGDRIRADEDFAAGITTYERYRQGLTSEQQRVMSQEVMWELYEAQISLAVDDPPRALTLAERSRARSLLDAMSGGQGEPVLPSALASRLGASERLVYYASLEHELVAWVIGPGGTVAVRTPLDRPLFERRVNAWLAALSANAPDADWQQQSERLYAWIIAPLGALLPDGASIIVVPDGVLNRVPFAALRDPVSGRYLVEQHQITMAPSATVLARALAPTGREWRTPQRALVAGDPASDGQRLDPLAGAAFEARAIAALYPRADLLEREAATRAAFSAHLADADVVHFGGHAIVSPDYPLLAHLEMAPEPGVSGSSDFDVADLAKVRTDATRLVVLAACQTGGGLVRRGEGVLSLARPFFIAGVPSVIATLWDIDDRQSAPFFLALHRQLSKGAPPSAALRQAQLEALSQQAPPSVWAAPILMGNPGSPRAF